MTTINGICKVVIVDDERAAIESLRLELETYPEVSIRGMASTGSKGKKMIMDLCPDLLFLDIELPDTQGIKLLSEMRGEITWNMKVVFYTAYNNYLLEALRESAFDYLLKPFVREELDIVMNRYRNSFSSHQAFPSFETSVTALLPQRDTFMISTITGFKLLRIEEIGYFEYIKNKRFWQVTLFNQAKWSLKKNTVAEDIIGYSKSFVQISQSAIVNVAYLAVVNGKECKLYPPFNDREDLVISRGFLKDLQDRFFVI